MDNIPQRFYDHPDLRFMLLDIFYRTDILNALKRGMREDEIYDIYIDYIETEGVPGTVIRSNGKPFYYKHYKLL